MGQGITQHSRADADRSVKLLPHATALLSTWLNALGSAGIFALMCLICADVIGRYVFNSPIAGVTEIVQLSIVVIVFVQLADTSAHGRLTRADSLLDSLKLHRPRIAHSIDGVASLCGVTLMAILAYGVIPAAVKDFSQGSFSGTVGIFTFPSWPVKTVIGLGSVLTGLQLLLSARASFAGARHATPEVER